MPEPPPDGPENGARLLAKLGPGSPDGALYALVLATADGSWEGSAKVREVDGAIEHGTWTRADPPPAWLAHAAHALLRTAWQRRRAGHPWPRRLSRWRPTPDTVEPG